MKRAFAGLRRRPWSVAFVLGLVIAFGSVWTHQDRGSRERARRDRTADPLQATYVDLIQAARPIVERLNLDTWYRAVVPQVISDFSSSGSLSMAWPDGRDPGPAARDSILAVLEQPDLVPLVEHDVAVGIHTVLDELSAVSPRPRVATLMGTLDGSQFCVQIRSVTRSTTSQDQFLVRTRRRFYQPRESLRLGSPVRSDLLGVCTYVRRFGMPGDHVRAWLAATFESRQFSPPTATDEFIDPLSVASILISENLDAGVNVFRRGCQTGDRAACMREFYPAGVPPQPSGPVSLVDGDRSVSVTRTPGDVPGRLEEEFGSVAFAEFWASDEPFEVAFESAFGVHPAEWAYAVTTETAGTVRASPQPAVATAGTSLLLMILGLALGTRAALRRRVA